MLLTRTIGEVAYKGGALDIRTFTCKDCAEWRDKPSRCVFLGEPASKPVAKRGESCIAFVPKEDK